MSASNSNNTNSNEKSNSPNNEIMSPFDDVFEFGSNDPFASNDDPSQQQQNNSNIRTGNSKSETDRNLSSGSPHEKDSNDDDDDSDHSFTKTPMVGGDMMKFESVEIFDNLDSKDGSTQDLNQSTKDNVTRMRFATLRDKNNNTTKNHSSVNRSGTMKWAQQNIKKAFKDEKNIDEAEDAARRNRSSELRSVFFNLPLPNEMKDDEGKPIMNYSRNKIRTTKYTPLSFFPKNIFNQFKNFANVYFLILIILGAFQIFGVPNAGLAAVPLIVIIILTAIKDGFEDSRRTILDMEVNNTKTHILDGVENENVPFDHVSMWRKFKKANTKLMMRFFQFLNERFTATGKDARKERKLNEMRLKKSGRGLPRNSLESYQSYRPSADYTRPSYDMIRPSLDYDNNTFINNNNGATIVDPNLPVRPECKFKKNYWKNVRVGDIVRVHNNDEIPADLIILSTSDNDGGCYVETKNLDGETNLKVRQSLKCSSNIKTSRDITRSKFWIESEGPHSNLYLYQGNLKWIDSDTNSYHNEPISINNMLLRGCTLRNTKWAMGVVLFTGDDTKIMLNSGVTPTKKSRISRELNLSVLFNFVFLFCLCFVAGIINGVYYSRKPESRDYFEFGTIAGKPATNGFVSFWVALILYQSLVPISLYISIEIIKTAQAIFIYLDVMLYNTKLDYPCTPKSWNISDDLGQIEYIFSDKTGTLTQNVMEFKKCTINGVSYGRAYTEALAGLRKRQGIDVEEEGQREREAIRIDREEMIAKLESISENSQFDPELLTFVSKEFANDLDGTSGDTQQKCCSHFMLALALCHTVLVEKNEQDPNKLDLQAQSPDEAALVTTARDVGFSLIDNKKNIIIIEIQGVQKEFEVLNILEFNSSRKRMSCIIKLPAKDADSDPSALLICKGADSIIYSRLDPGKNDENLLEKTALHLEQYATEGLRTLCVAQREISWTEYLTWSEKYNVAAEALVDREGELDKVSELIERDLILLGGTAIEDKLQDGVPDSIALLAEAGIKLWVLTGDKVETAINIGFSCNVLNTDMELLVIKADGDDVKDLGHDPESIVLNLTTKYLNEKFGLSGTEEDLEHAKNDHSVPKNDFAVIIDGDALKIALTGPEMRRNFLLLCKNCKAVLCCRVSPSQKAAVVKLVKQSLDVMTLAIGDGSNDVAMIQSADVGVGIAGEEGRQAVMCSDFAIGQFRYLTRLLLVHGRWCYKRLAEMIPQFFYKNLIFTMTLFWYGVHNDFDGSYLFEFTYLTFYNLAFTSVPVILMGVLDQDVSDKISMIVPELYRSGILRKDWNQTKFLWYMFDGLYQSAICYFFPYLVYRRNMIVTNNGLGLDHRFYVGVPVTGIAVISCNMYILMGQKRWDWFTGLFIILSIAVYFGWTGIWSSSLNSYEFFKSADRVYSTPSFWAVLVIGIFFCILPRFTFNSVQQMINPTDVDIVKEMWANGAYDAYPENYDPTDPEQKKIKRDDFMPSDNIFEGEFNAQDAVRGDSGMESRDSVIVEEIPMDSYDKNAIDQGQDIRWVPSTSSAATGRAPMKSMDSWREGRNSMNLSHVRTSLDRTREHMLASNQLDNRYSVERARVSLDLPGLTQAANLMKKSSRS
ncbi:similar to Saccharomyces cerevisiae YER166W DNF1 Aminophospholipid translocase (flippase) that localizes primarily to the plasma membrane [Maudiozyma saulgeensis]|uniref:Phospholipid-transporting ATPase n=1 Tax=Maudiozyma saulgeensis TaxID=1789683 RepID=A0A1X7R6R7_9SACH|nr:similar to Saccharomyces cerevisiae YER166W DNF1 Aminophospholipid translocase (flippase) that localizes primarily to the plasma membrane [Kazachstania saulgeensis]